MRWKDAHLYILCTIRNKEWFKLIHYFRPPGTKNRRTQIIAEKTYTDTEMGIKLSLNSPIKNLGGEVTIRTSPSELTALAKANIDNDQYYGKVIYLHTYKQYHPHPYQTEEVV